MGLIENNGPPTLVNVNASAATDNTVITNTDGLKAIRVINGWLYNNSGADCDVTIKSGSTTILGPYTIPAKGYLPLRGDGNIPAFACGYGANLVVTCSVGSAIKGMLNAYTI